MQKGECTARVGWKKNGRRVEEGDWEGLGLGWRVLSGKAHSPFGFAQGKQESSPKLRGMGRRWLCHAVIGEFCGWDYAVKAVAELPHSIGALDGVGVGIGIGRCWVNRGGGFGA